MNGKNHDCSWKLVRTPDVLSGIITGKKDVNQASEKGDYPFFSCARETSLFSNAFLLDTNAIIIAGNGAYAGFIKKYSGRFDLYQRTYALFNFRENVNWKFVYYVFKYHFQRQFIGGTTGTAIPYITKPIITNFQFAIPEDISVQDRIASVLSAYDDLIENNRRRIELLEKAARLIYEEWFICFRFPGYENTKIVDGVPMGWERGILSDFYDTRTGGTPSRRSPEFFDGEINWVKTQELNEGFIFETEEKVTEDGLNVSSAKIFPINTVLVSIYAGTNIGRAGILAKPAACNQACVGLFPKHENSNHIYAHLFLQTVRKKLIGFSQGSAQTNISQQLLRKLAMLFPDGKLMRGFMDMVLPIYEKIKNLQRQNLCLAKSRDLLLPRLIKGELIDPKNGGFE